MSQQLHKISIQKTYRVGLFLIGLAFAPICRSAPVVVPPYAFSGFVHTAFITTFPLVDELTTPIVALPPLSTQGGSGETASQVTFGAHLVPQPQLLAAASVASNDPSKGASADLLMELDYYFIASGPGPLVTIDISGFGNASFPGGAFLGVHAPPILAPINVSSPFALSWVLNTSFTATVGQPYQVSMVIQVIAGSAGDGVVTRDAFVDPIVSIDPSNPNADQYHLDFSPGIGNASAPEPAGMTMGAAGIAVLWALGRRRKESRPAVR